MNRMNEANGKKPPTAAEIRKAKLAKELRANLMKRKEQARARRSGDGDERAEGLLGKKPAKEDDSR